MPEPTIENQIKLGLLQNNLIPINKYNKTYITSLGEDNYSLLDLPNIILNGISTEDYDELSNRGRIIYGMIIVLPETKLSSYDNYMNYKIFYFMINNVRYVFMIDEIYDESEASEGEDDYENSCDCCMGSWIDEPNEYGRCICICSNCEDDLRSCRYKCYSI